METALPKGKRKRWHFIKSGFRSLGAEGAYFIDKVAPSLLLNALFPGSRMLTMAIGGCSVSTALGTNARLSRHQ